MIQSVVLASAAAGVLTAAAVIGITGLLIAVLLGVAANVFEVPVDEKAIAIRDVLPGYPQHNTKSNRSSHSKHLKYL